MTQESEYKLRAIDIQKQSAEVGRLLIEESGIKDFFAKVTLAVALPDSERSKEDKKIAGAFEKIVANRYQQKYDKPFLGKIDKILTSTWNLDGSNYLGIDVTYGEMEKNNVSKKMLIIGAVSSDNRRVQIYRADKDGDLDLWSPFKDVEKKIEKFMLVD